MKKFVLLTLLPAIGAGAAHAALTDNLIGYYDFEANGTPGLANKASGATTHNGAFIGTPSNDAGAGFAGSPSFAGTNYDAGTEATTNRSPMLVGKALNVVKGTAPAANGGQFTVSTLTSRGPGTGGDFGTLGTQFSVSTWFYLAPDIDNVTLSANDLRDFVFESALDGASNTPVYDISWGTTGADTTIYSPYVGQSQFPAGNANLAANAWHNVVHTFTVSEANTVMNVYVDGNFIASGAAATTAVDFRGINFGANRAGTRVFDGMIDEIGIWNRPLSAAEVTEVFQRGISGQTLTASKLTVNLSVTPASTGTVSGTGVYDANAMVPVSAVGNPGYVFSSWSGDFAGQPASFTHTVTAPVTATATFDPDTSDTDQDGLSNYDEIAIYLTLPNNPDTDGDLIPDGAEVNTTLTNPTTSDASLVSFIRSNLTGAQAGAVAVRTPRIERDSVTGAVSLFLSISGSASQTGLQPIDLNQASASIVPAGDGWNITFPAPSNAVNNYIILGAP